MTALLLWDIDGTLLLKASKEHALALHEAIEEVHGVRADGSVRVEAAGRTDQDIARQILLQLGVSALRIDEGMAAVHEACAAAYVRLCPPDLSAHVAPGIPDLLAELSARDDVKLSLVTGNLEPIARVKLRAAGIGGFFPSGQGGFGSDSEDRSDLPAIARARAGDHPRASTWVIGDTPRDIACARADGVGVLCIATGPYAAEDLSGADAVARDVAELRELLHARLGSDPQVGPTPARRGQT